jgi:hypothetical protein
MRFENRWPRFFENPAKRELLISDFRHVSTLS